MINRKPSELNNQQISEHDTYADSDQEEDLTDEWDGDDLDYDDCYDAWWANRWICVYSYGVHFFVPMVYAGTAVGQMDCVLTMS